MCSPGRSLNGTDHVNCLVLLQTIRWTFDALLDDALQLLDAAATAASAVGGLDAGCEVALATLRDELMEVGEMLRAVETTASRFRLDGRSDSLRTLKDLAEVLLVRVNQVRVPLGDAIRGRAQA